VQVGRYVKIGKLVTVQCRVTLSTLGTITTNVQIQGLPFTAENTTNQVGTGIVRWTSLTTAVVYLGGTVEPNSTAITIVAAAAASTSLSALAQADLSATTSFDANVTYRATA
jgi:hypothetical protein